MSPRRRPGSATGHASVVSSMCTRWPPGPRRADRMFGLRSAAPRQAEAWRCWRDRGSEASGARCYGLGKGSACLSMSLAPRVHAGLTSSGTPGARYLLGDRPARAGRFHEPAQGTQEQHRLIDQASTVPGPQRTARRPSGCPLRTCPSGRRRPRRRVAISRLPLGREAHRCAAPFRPRLLAIGRG